jgi:hypothetical protein
MPAWISTVCARIFIGLAFVAQDISLSYAKCSITQLM